MAKEFPLYGVNITDLYDFTDKKANSATYTAYMLSRLQPMFKYEGLPDTIPQREYELMLMCGGCVGITEVNGKFYAFNGGLGGELNEYYMPTLFTVANPYLNISKSYKIDNECIIIPNDSMYMGLLPLIIKYSSALAENDISLNLADISTRMTTLITVTDDDTYKSAVGYIDDIVKGKLGVISTNAFLDGIKAQPYADGNSVNIITNLIEYRQYLRAGLFNDLGVNSNYNMKRERIVSSEAQMNDDALIPLIADMLNNRRLGWEKVNKKFGTNVSVELNSVWKLHEQEVETTIIQMENSDNSSQLEGGENNEIDKSISELEN